MAEALKSITAYEYVGVIAPGAIFSLGLSLAVPAVKAVLGDRVSLGEFGIFLVVSFVVGHVVQAVGNLAEIAIWRLIGRPSDSVRHDGQRLLTPHQRLDLQARASALEGDAIDLVSIPPYAWATIVSRIYAKVQAAGRAERIDAFNRTYGLLRGVSVAFLMIATWLACNRADPKLVALSTVFGLATAWRMIRAGRYYARELFLEFLNLPTGLVSFPPSGAEPSDG
jgi:hypothetical protein